MEDRPDISTYTIASSSSSMSMLGPHHDMMCGKACPIAAAVAGHQAKATREDYYLGALEERATIDVVRAMTNECELRSGIEPRRCFVGVGRQKCLRSPLSDERMTPSKATNHTIVLEFFFGGDDHERPRRLHRWHVDLQFNPNTTPNSYTVLHPTPIHCN